MKASRVLLVVVSVSVVGMFGALEAGSATGDLASSALGISFIPNSTSTLRMERDGRTYEVDLVARTVHEIDPPRGAGSSQDNGAASSSLSSQSGGAAIFAKNCATCHGADAKGVVGLRTPDFTDPKTQANLKDEQIVTTIESGKPGTMMPSWAGKLSQRQILAVAGYLRSLGSSGPLAPGSGQPAGSKRALISTNPATTPYSPYPQAAAWTRRDSM